MEATLYATLGVPANATLADIHAAYTRALASLRARIGQPDEPAPDAIDALREAYVTLSNPERRAAYDESLATPAASKPAPALHLEPIDGDAPDGAAPAASSTIKTAVAGGTSAHAEERHWLEFTGDGSSYFRIWIVNLLLSIVTLGIYSAWAKVRREQYFHRNLRLVGSAFDYHGEPKAILKGRLIAASFFVVLSLAQHFNPLVYLVLILASLPLIPWLLVRTYRFRAHNTSFRGLRFSFDGSYVEALKVFLGYGLLTLVTLGLCLPLWFRAQRRYIVNHLSFASTRFRNDLGIWPIYRIFLLPMLFAIGAFLLLIFAIGSIAASMKGNADPAAFVGIAMLGYFAIILVGMLLVGPYLRVRIANLVWNSTTLGIHYTQSVMRFLPYVGIVASNFVLTVLTLGLYRPWAQVRVARYRAETAALVALAPLDEFIAGEQSKATAVGEEMADMFDFDIAL